ncbi:MAG: septation protein IspZ [Xanthobacteraceae bacterium]|nr:septation protein IspZ [Xanthobacteraceae bacterium]
MVFLGIYLATGSLPLAVGCALAIGAGQFAFAKLRRRRIEVMQWLSLMLVVVLGGAALITNDSRFMMAKPSIIHFAIGAVMLRPGWMERYMPPIVKEHVSESVLVASGYSWAGLMFILGLLNHYFAAETSPMVWGWFMTVGAIGAKVAAFVTQYLVLQILVRRDLHQLKNETGLKGG